MPLSPFFWNVLKVGVPGQGKRRSLQAPARHSWEAICTVADHGQVVRNGLGLHPELGYNAGFIAQDLAPAVQLNDPCAYNALTEVFVGCTNEHLLHTVIFGCFGGSGSERIIGLIVDHGPHHHSHGFERFFQDRELREQLWSHAFAGLVSWIQIVAKRLHDLISCNPNVGATALDHGPNEIPDSTHCADFLALRIFRTWYCERLPEQFT